MTVLRNDTEDDRFQFDIAVKQQCRELRNIVNASRTRLGLDLIPMHDDEEINEHPTRGDTHD